MCPCTRRSARRSSTAAPAGSPEARPGGVGLLPRVQLPLVVLVGRDGRKGLGRGARIPYVDGLRAGGRLLVAPVTPRIADTAGDAGAKRLPTRGQGRWPGRARPG